MCIKSIQLAQPGGEPRTDLSVLTPRSYELEPHWTAYKGNTFLLPPLLPRHHHPYPHGLPTADMLLKTLAALALLFSASAVPGSEWGGEHSPAHAVAPATMHANAKTPTARLCTEEFSPNGQYIDHGCGITIQTHRKRYSGVLCVRTHADTKEGDDVFLAPCEALTTSGGRWDMLIGSTSIRNMQASEPGYCLAASSDRTRVVMAKCKDCEDQRWFTSLSDGYVGKIQWGGPESNLCLANPGSGRNVRELKLDWCNDFPGQVWEMSQLGEATG